MESSRSPSHGQGRGLIPPNQCVQPIELREPHLSMAKESSTDAVESGSKLLGTIIGKPLTETIPDQSTGFKLSAFAQEFVPKSYSTEVVQNDIAEQYPVSTDPDPLLDYSIQILSEITYSPGHYEHLSHQLLSTLNSWPSVDEVLPELVEGILNQASWEPNFRYNGARLCNILSRDLKTQNPTCGFRSILFNRCKQIHEERKNLMQSDAEYLRGFALFLSEVFVHMTQKETGLRFSVLRNAVRDLIQTLLDHPTPGNLKCLCQILKLTGSFIEDDDRKSNHHGLSVAMDQLMANINTVAVTVGMPQHMKELLLNVIELRSSDWGRAPKDAQASSNSTTSLGVYYGPDGQALTAEEQEFLNEGIGRQEEEEDDYEYGDDEGMDDEMLAAFEKFLMMNNDRTHS